MNAVHVILFFILVVFAIIIYVITIGFGIDIFSEAKNLLSGTLIPLFGGPLGFFLVAGMVGIIITALILFKAGAGK